MLQPTQPGKQTATPPTTDMWRHRQHTHMCSCARACMIHDATNSCLNFPNPQVPTTRNNTGCAACPKGARSGGLCSNGCCSDHPMLQIDKWYCCQHHIQSALCWCEYASTLHTPVGSIHRSYTTNVCDAALAHGMAAAAAAAVHSECGAGGVPNVKTRTHTHTPLPSTNCSEGQGTRLHQNPSGSGGHK